jgi:hypothetical protein
MQLLKVNGQHTVFKIELEEMPDGMAWAFETAMKKASFTANTWQGRGELKRFSNIFQGDLAKNAFLLAVELLKKPLFDRMVEYDRIRTDGFKNPDLYDLALEKDGLFTIEVKSSAEKTLSLIEDVCESRRIIVNLNNCHEKYSDLLVQTFFIAKHGHFFVNDDLTKPLNEQSAKAYVDAMKSSGVEIYIVGGATMAMQIEASNQTFVVANAMANARQRTYANIMIKDAMDASAVMRHLSDMVKQD